MNVSKKDWSKKQFSIGSVNIDLNDLPYLIRWGIETKRLTHGICIEHMLKFETGSSKACTECCSKARELLTS